MGDPADDYEADLDELTDYDDYDDDEPCTWCGGEGIQDNDDPLWYGFDRGWIPCRCCSGTGRRSQQTIF